MITIDFSEPAYRALPRVRSKNQPPIGHGDVVGFTVGAWKGVASLERAKRRARVQPRVTVPRREKQPQ
jgi:hypothetical protein